MTKKHFIALADALRRARPTSTDTNWGKISYDQWWHDVRHIAHFCQGQSPNFNYEKWMAAIKN